MDPSGHDGGVRLGIVTPVLTLLPGAHAAWERDAPWEDVVRIARAADRLGYHHLSCSEHVAVPVDVAEARGGRYYDPLATLGHLSAVTDRILLATYVLVLGYHHPLEIAKRYGTLDRVSGGRLVLGVGVGSLAEEFGLLGAPFADRGERADDALRALRAAWGETRPAYAGSHVTFGDVIVDPPAVRTDTPVWVGGRTARSLRRARALADGWAPFGLTRDEVAGMLAAPADLPPDPPADLPPDPPAARPFEVVLQPGRPLDPVARPDEAAAALRRWEAAGATIVTLRFVHHSAAHYVEQLEAAMALDPADAAP